MFVVLGMGGCSKVIGCGVIGFVQPMHLEVAGHLGLPGCIRPIARCANSQRTYCRSISLQRIFIAEDIICVQPT